MKTVITLLKQLWLFTFGLVGILQLLALSLLTMILFSLIFTAAKCYNGVLLGYRYSRSKDWPLPFNTLKLATFK